MFRFFAHACNSLMQHPQYSKVFCPACLKDSPNILACINFFSLYMIPQSYEVDKLQLSVRYKSFQKILHPDKLKSKGIDEQDYSKLLQDSFSTLSDDIERAKYMLTIYGQDPNDISVSDADFLEEQMEKRFIIATGSQEDIMKISKDAKNNSEVIVKKLKELFDQFDWENAKNKIGKLSFYKKLEHEAHEKLQHL